MVFLDAHVECLDGWLEPLVERIASDRSVVAVPYIDRIDKYEMSYLYPYSMAQ
jgi:polypeptide N-acetylgalactosaminyltransferase